MHRIRLLLTHRQSALVLLGGLACVLVAIVALATQIADLVPHENVRRLNLSNQLDQVVAAHISGSLRATDRILDRVSSRMLDDPGLWYAPMTMPSNGSCAARPTHRLPATSLWSIATA